MPSNLMMSSYSRCYWIRESASTVCSKGRISGARQYYTCVVRRGVWGVPGCYWSMEPRLRYKMNGTRHLSCTVFAPDGQIWSIFLHSLDVTLISRTSRLNKWLIIINIY